MTKRRFIPLPRWTPWWKKPMPKMRMLQGFSVGENAAHGWYLKDYELIMEAEVCLSIKTNGVRNTMTELFKIARAQYQREIGDYWKDELPGDCEDQCLWFLNYSAAAGLQIRDFWLCICETETGEYHCVLLLDQPGDETLVIDFRKTDPFIPLGSPVFAKYKWHSMARRDVNEWFMCFKRRVK